MEKQKSNRELMQEAVEFIAGRKPKLVIWVSWTKENGISTHGKAIEQNDNGCIVDGGPVFLPYPVQVNFEQITQIDIDYA